MGPGCGKRPEKAKLRVGDSRTRMGGYRVDTTTDQQDPRSGEARGESPDHEYCMDLMSLATGARSRQQIQAGCRVEDLKGCGCTSAKMDDYQNQTEWP